MAWLSIGASTALAVNDTGASLPLEFTAPQCRVWNEGPAACRVRYSPLGDAATMADDADMVLPAGLLEVHGKAGMRFIAARTKAGEATTLHIICGSGD